MALVGFIGDAFRSPGEDTVKHSDGLRVRRPWTEQLVLALILACQLLLEPLYGRLWAAGCEIISVHSACDIQSWVVEVAGAGSTYFEAYTRHEASVFFLPILRRVACTIETEIKFTHHVLISRLPVFNRDLYEHWPTGFGIKVRTLYVRAEDAKAAFVLIAGALANDIA